MITYIIFNKEKEGSQEKAVESGNHSLVEVELYNDRLFNDISKAFCTESEHIVIEELKNKEEKQK